MSIQRYDLSGELYAADNGEWIAYSDHIADIEHLERVHRNEINELRWMNSVTRDDSFRQGYLEGIEDCISIANEEKFINDMGKQIPAMGALWNIIVKMQDLRGIK